MAAPIVVKGATFEPGAPMTLFRTRIVGGGTGPTGLREQYDVAPDSRFLMNVEFDQGSASPITVVLNWGAALTR